MSTLYTNLRAPRRLRATTRMGQLLLSLLMALIGSCILALPGFASVATQTTGGKWSCADNFKELTPDLTRTPIQADLNAGYYQGILENTGNESFVVKGQFPHSILLTWVIDDLNGQRIDSLTDQQITPDPGNVNPFLPGSLVLALKRSYTIFFAPPGAPVPSNIPASNVLRLPSASENTSTNNRMYITMRSYWSEPGYPRSGGPLPTIQAVSAANPSNFVPCPSTGEGTPPLSPFEIPTGGGGKILFFRPPNDLVPLADGTGQATPNGCTDYVMAQLSATTPNLIKVHKVAVFPDNQHYTPDSVWTNNFDVRYIGLEANGASILGKRSDVAMNEIKLQADGSAYFLALSRVARITPGERRQLLQYAQANNWNVIESAKEGPEFAPFITYRNKLPTSSFKYALSAVPCFGPNLGVWSNAPASYASSSANMGPYYIDGAICKVGDILSNACTRQIG